MTDDVCTPEELMDLLKIDDESLRKVLKEGDIPGRYLGGHWRFSRNAVIHWLGDMTVNQMIHIGREDTIRRQEDVAQSKQQSAETTTATTTSESTATDTAQQSSQSQTSVTRQPAISQRQQQATRNFNKLDTMQKGDLLASVEL